MQSAARRGAAPSCAYRERNGRGYRRGPAYNRRCVLGIAFDGTGAGTDGTIWGGEFLVASLGDFERAAHLRTWALPGGAASVRDARRNAFALLSELGLLEHPGLSGSWAA